MSMHIDARPGDIASHVITAGDPDRISYLAEHYLENAAWFLKRIFEAKNIPIWVDLWGHDVNHDWNWWYKQTAYYMPYILGEQ